jgi:hypothetical protein
VKPLSLRAIKAFAIDFCGLENPHYLKISKNRIEFKLNARELVAVLETLGKKEPNRTHGERKDYYFTQFLVGGDKAKVIRVQMAVSFGLSLRRARDDRLVFINKQ